MKIAVIGDVMLDRYQYGDCFRNSPEAPVPIVNIFKTEDRLGGAANVANNLKGLGVDVTLFGTVGSDDEADCIGRMLTEKGIKCDLTKEGKTIVKQRVISNGKQVARMDYDYKMRPAVFNPSGFDLIVVSDYHKGTVPENIGEICSGLNYIVDAKKDFHRYSSALFVTPNRQEFENEFGLCLSISELINTARNYCKAKFVITLGEDGLLYVDDRVHIHCKTDVKDVFDVTGAGDTVLAVLAYSLVSGVPMSEALELANLAAGMVVGKFGTSAVILDELVGKARIVSLVRESEKLSDCGDAQITYLFDLFKRSRRMICGETAEVAEFLVWAEKNKERYARFH
jgi:D-beta-D-heptose 7-phosphate kinase/D-beta-D-heptose 1-phosphate adenosyltransferase